MDSNSQRSDTDPFVSYYQKSLCNLQTTNNELLREIIQKNHSCTFFRDQSISCLSMDGTASGEIGYTLIDEFREKLPLTTYEDYRDYVDRTVLNGEKNLFSSENTVYFTLSSGTTANIKILPATSTTMRKVNQVGQLGSFIIRRSFPSSSFSSPNQRSFFLQHGRKSEMYSRSKDGTPIGPIGQYLSAVVSFPRTHTLLSNDNILALDTIEGITNFETSIFVQVVFALANLNIYSYSVPFAPTFVHTVKIIENYFEELSLCISTANFDNCSLVRKNISDSNFISMLNQTLNAMIIEHGGETYQLERVKHIRNECLKKKVPGILHRLWPSMIYASTAIGSTFAIYKSDIQFYCGERLPLINILAYGTSEGFFGSLASIHTDEYFLLPTHAFYEFIKEEDIHQVRRLKFEF